MIFTGEPGIIDIIYDYHCGIGYRKLKKIINNNFNQVKNNKTLIELTEYLSSCLNKGARGLKGLLNSSLPRVLIAAIVLP